MSRKNIIGLGVVFFVFLLIKKGFSKNMVSLILLVLPVMFFEVYFDFKITDYLGNIYSSISSEVASSGGNVGIRMYGIQYYYELFKETGFIGVGMSKSPQVMKGFLDFGFNFADQGIFATFFMFGFPSLILILFTYFKIFKDLRVSTKIDQNDYSNYQEKIIREAIFLFFAYRILTFSHIYFWHQSSIWRGVLFYMIYKTTSKLKNIQKGV